MIEQNSTNFLFQPYIIIALASTAFGGGIENNPIMNSLNTIIDSLESWFGLGGKYSKTPQVTTGGEYIENATDLVLYIDIRKVADVRITIGFLKVDPGDEVVLYYGFGSPGNCLIQNVEVESGQTLEFCAVKFYIVITGSVNLWYSYVYITEP